MKSNGKSPGGSDAATSASVLESLHARCEGLQLHLERVLELECLSRRPGYMSHQDQVIVRSARAFLEAVR